MSKFRGKGIFIKITISGDVNQSRVIIIHSFVGHDRILVYFYVECA